MKHILTIIGLALTLSAGAQQQYGSIATVWSVANFTNVTGTATNLATTVSVTKFDNFALQFRGGFTNPCAGTIAVQWETSLDGTFNVTNNPASAGSSGWFAIPLTNSGTVVTWTTNIAVNSVGYWRVTWLTNSAGQSMTNVSITAYAKPKRQG